MKTQIDMVTKKLMGVNSRNDCGWISSRALRLDNSDFDSDEEASYVNNQMGALRPMTKGLT